MKQNLFLFFFIGLLFFLEFNLNAVPIRMSVAPRGTNQVELTFGPVVPGVRYGVLVRTNDPHGHWIGFGPGFVGTSNGTISAVCNLADTGGPTVGTLSNWTFVAGSWEDSDGDGLPDLYEELVTHTDPNSGDDGYADPDRDGWNNIDELANNTDPLAPDLPPGPDGLTFNYDRNGLANLKWIQNGATPEYFEVERLARTAQWVTNFPPRFPGRTNQPPFTRRTNLFPNRTNVLRPPFPPGTNGRTNVFPRPFPVTNRWTNRPFPPGAYPPMRGHMVITTNEPQIAGRIPGKPGVHEYQWTDTNAPPLSFTNPGAAYRVRAHFAPPMRAELTEINVQTIRRATERLGAVELTNGYDLILTNPFPYARNLLLVRDKNDPQWRAGGFFVSGTNRSPMHFQADLKGMMTDPQAPIVLPQVHFLSNLIDPEFIAGPGEDSDGDGLPDVYEVFVTKTDPMKTDTGNIGIIDGFKELGGDGWSALEKFRRRVDPNQRAQPPAAVELTHPSSAEIMQALQPKSDLHFDAKVEVRLPGSKAFQPIEQFPSALTRLLNWRQRNERRDFDVRVSWQYPDTASDQFSQSPYPDAPYSVQSLFLLVREAELRIIETFRQTLAARPPLTPVDMSNYTATIKSAFAKDDIDQSTLMGEMMALQDNQAQDFYGKVIDQNGMPVAGADINAELQAMERPGNSRKTQTDEQGLFEFTGIRGRSLNVTPQKSGYRIEGHGLGMKGQNGPETSPNNPAVYVMWKLKGPEPMIHDSKRYTLKPEQRTYTIDLLSKKMVEGTNDSGDLYVQFQRPSEIKTREPFAWSLTMRAISGGLIQVTNDDYLYEAPERGYKPQFEIDITETNRDWRGHEETFYIKSRNGVAYGHFHIRIEPENREGASVQIESYMNPSGSRNLEFDPAKQTEYTSPATKAPQPPIVPESPKPSKVAFTNASGQVVMWGSMVLPFVKPGTRFTAVAAGGEHSLAVTTDGTVIAWGRNLSGEANVPRGLSNVVAVAAGGRSGSGFSVALRRDGTVVAWGDYSAGQTNVPPGLSNVIAISAGTVHCLALKSGGTVTGWGLNEDGKTQGRAGLSNVIAIAAGGEQSVALRRDGTVAAWGGNQWRPATVPEGLSNVVSICSGAYFNLALKNDGTVAGWGAELPKDLTNVAAIAAGHWNGLALKRDGTVTEWGREIPFASQAPRGLSNVVAISCGGSDYADHVLALKADGTIVGWGNNSYCQSLIPGGLTNIISISGGADHYLALQSDGSVVALGGGEHQGYGQTTVPADLGLVKQTAAGWTRSAVTRLDGSIASWGEPILRLTGVVGNLTNVTEVALTYNDTLALRADGSVVVWGPLAAAPTQIFTNAVAIAGATHHGLVLKRDGTVSAWGADGGLAKAAPPDLSDVIAIAAAGEYAGDHDLALKRDGTIAAWGINNAGQTNVPEDLTSVMAIAAGANHSLALRRDKTVVAWGANDAGQSAIPEGLSNVIAIAGGRLSSAAIVFVPQPTPSFVSMAARRWIRASAAIVLLFIVGGFVWLLSRRRKSETGGAG